VAALKRHSPTRLLPLSVVSLESECTTLRFFRHLHVLLFVRTPIVSPCGESRRDRRILMDVSSS
jgi:hypothetical protein